ncbi:MAG: hypothetical protein R3F61_23295 [Myxococcota bacterium]
MDARITWTVAAVSLVGLLLVARFYVGTMIEEETQAVVVSREPTRIRTPKPRPERTEDALDPMKDLIGRVYSLGEVDPGDGADEARAEAHQALTALEAWRPANPEDAERATKLMQQLYNGLDQLKVADASIRAHVLQAWVATGTGTPDAIAKLESQKAASPGDFNW